MTAEEKKDIGALDRGLQGIRQVYDDFVARMKTGQGLFRIFHKDPQRKDPAIKAHFKTPFAMVDSEGKVILEAGGVVELAFWARLGSQSGQLWYSGGVSSLGEFLYMRTTQFPYYTLTPKTSKAKPAVTPNMRTPDFGKKP